MKDEGIKAVEMKRRLQKEAEKKLSKLSGKEQLELLSQKFGYLKKTRKAARVA